MFDLVKDERPVVYSTGGTEELPAWARQLAELLPEALALAEASGGDGKAAGDAEAAAAQTDAAAPASREEDAPAALPVTPRTDAVRRLARLEREAAEWARVGARARSMAGTAGDGKAAGLAALARLAAERERAARRAQAALLRDPAVAAAWRAERERRSRRDAEAAAARVTERLAAGDVPGAIAALAAVPPDQPGREVLARAVVAELDRYFATLTAELAAAGAEEARAVLARLQGFPAARLEARALRALHGVWLAAARRAFPDGAERFRVIWLGGGRAALAEPLPDGRFRVLAALGAPGLRPGRVIDARRRRPVPLRPAGGR